MPQHESFDFPATPEILQFIANMQQSQNQAELPRYRCHKEVHAVKILSMGLVGDNSQQVIIPADPGYEDIPVSDEWVEKHNPQSGGYFVVYSDGYKSFSPAKAFEEGYTRI